MFAQIVTILATVAEVLSGLRNFFQTRAAAKTAQENDNAKVDAAAVARRDVEHPISVQDDPYNRDNAPADKPGV